MIYSRTKKGTYYKKGGRSHPTTPLDGSFTFIWKKDYMPYFSVSMSYLVGWIFWRELRIYLQGIWCLDKFEPIIHELK